MELDNIKKLWNDVDVLKENQPINNEKIKEMIRNKGETALSKLIRMARFDMLGTLPCGIVVCILGSEFILAGGNYSLLPLSLLIICLAITPVYVHAYLSLKRIDFSTMSVKDVSDKILIYQNMIEKVRSYGAFIFVIFMSIWIFFDGYLEYGGFDWSYVIFGLIFIPIGVVGTLYLYKKLYFNRIDQIKQSLNELNEFYEK